MIIAIIVVFKRLVITLQVIAVQLQEATVKAQLSRNLKKVGEPFYSKYLGKSYQRYKTYIPAVSSNLKIRATSVEYVGRNEIFIEIKQKEDMEENKTLLPKEDNPLTRIVYAYVNGKISDNELIKSIKEMSDEYPYNKNNIKPFSLEAAKTGKPVCTRDGHKARIICFDFRDVEEICCLIAAVDYGEAEKIYYYDSCGKYRGGDSSKYDLMMLPEKKEGWINIIKTEDGGYCCKGEVNSDYNDAFIENINVLDNRGITVRIEWEE